MTDFDILSETKEIVQKLNELDEYFDSLAEKQRETDYKLSDLYHYIENNQLKTNECYRIIKEIKKQREIRRRLKNDYELLKTFNNNYGRLNNSNNRKMLLAEVNKMNKQLNQKYKNRVYTEEEMRQILGKKEVEEL